VLKHRCQGNRMFGLPGKVSTVDKYQGEQNDCKSTPSSNLTEKRKRWKC
jgi:intron-binding protein aquarius